MTSFLCAPRPPFVRTQCAYALLVFTSRSRPLSPPPFNLLRLALQPLIAAVLKLLRRLPSLCRHLGLAGYLFCHCSPPTAPTGAMLDGHYGQLTDEGRLEEGLEGRDDEGLVEMEMATAAGEKDSEAAALKFIARAMASDVRLFPEAVVAHARGVRGSAGSASARPQGRRADGRCRGCAPSFSSFDSLSSSEEEGEYQAEAHSKRPRQGAELAASVGQVEAGGGAMGEGGGGAMGVNLAVPRERQSSSTPVSAAAVAQTQGRLERLIEQINTFQGQLRELKETIEARHAAESRERAVQAESLDELKRSIASLASMIATLPHRQMPSSPQSLLLRQIRATAGNDGGIGVGARAPAGALPRSSTNGLDRTPSRDH